MINKLSRADYLRNLASAMESYEEGVGVQFEITNIINENEWVDYSFKNHGNMELLLVNCWRIKPEVSA